MNFALRCSWDCQDLIVLDESTQRKRPPNLERGDAMTKADLVEEISKVTGLNKKDASIIVNEIIANICRALAEGDKVELRGFGSFKVKERRARRARNPRTGEGVFVPAKLVPYFKASNELKVRVNTADQKIST